MYSDSIFINQLTVVRATKQPRKNLPYFLQIYSYKQMNITKLNKSAKKSAKQNLQKQKKFNNRYAITEPPQSYDSFTDPHSSYYFTSPTVKTNLKHLKKVIAQQRNSSEKKKLQLLIRQRKQMNMKFASIFKRRSHSSKTQDVTSKQLLRQTLGSMSLYYQTQKEKEGQLGLTSNKSAFKISNIDIQASKDKNFMEESFSDDNFNPKQSLNPQKMTKLKKTNSYQQEYSNRLAQTLHNKKRIKWMNYLQERKNMLLHKQSLDQK